MSRSLALQLHSLRREIAGDPKGVFRRVPSLGFDGVETAGAYGWPTGQWTKILAETKLQVVGAHIGLEQLESEWEQLTEFQRAVSNSRIVVPSLPRNLQTGEGYSQAARRLSSLGHRARSEGLAMFYHNHAYEFSPVAEDRCGMDILLAETDPAALSLEVDTYWVERGGVNSGDFILRHAERIGMIHAKEFCRDGRDVPVGQGDVDWKAIISLAENRGWPIIVEYEAEDPLPAVAAGARFLREL